MSYSEVEFVDAEESQANSCLYARVNIENKTNRRKKNLEKRISNKYEFVIPVESSELSTSDSNLHSTLVSRESLLSSRAIFGSADNIISDRSLQSESPYDGSFVRHNTGTFRKIQAPPPAIPPPYQVRGDYETVQSQPTTDACPFRRSKSINTKSLLVAENASSQLLESSNKPPQVLPNGSNTCPRKMVPQSFRLPREKPRPVPGTMMSLPTKPALKPQVPFPFKSQNSLPIPILPQRKPSPPENNSNNNQPTPAVNNNNNKTPSPTLNDHNYNRRQSSPLTINHTSPPPLPLPKPTKPLPSVPLKPILKPPFIPTLPIMPPTEATTPPQLKKQVPLSPPAIKPAKPPARLPPPPPAHSLTLPRKLTTPPSKSPSIGDYTLLTPISTSPVDTPTFSSMTDSSPDETKNIVTDEGYTILNVDNLQTNKPTKELELKRVGSLPLENNSKRIPPKKPPRLNMTEKTKITPAVNNDSNYTILSSLETSVMSLNDKPPATELNDRNSIKTMTMPSKATRGTPLKPPAYRMRSQSQTIASCINVSFNASNNHTNSVEVKPEAKNKGGHTSEGNIFSKVFQKSKRIREKDRGESKVSPTISSPIPCPHGAMKVIGLNPLLISDCVAYLKNPKHLREEGIFRIPGDLNQINLYHKQYDYSMKTILDEELDPNTISSLLKQHIRDNGGLLPTKEAGDLYSAVRRKNIEEIRTVVNRIPAEQKNMLREMIFLFKEVCQYAEENKMCTGSVATSCGLSIFPTVNAGNANLMLKSLIDNSDQVFN